MEKEKEKTKQKSAAQKTPVDESKKKSKIAMYWENPDRIKLEIMDMRAVLR